MINNISFLNFKSKLQTNNQKNVINNFASRPSNITPLPCDTISFSGNQQINNRHEHDFLNRNNDWRKVLKCEEASKAVSENAKPTNEYLKKIVETYFNSLLYDKTTNPKGAIEALRARAKSADSLAEKIANKIEAAFASNKGDIKEKIFTTRSEEEIKQNIKDISGARIVVREEIGGVMNDVVDNLCKMIEEENLIITEIENHLCSEANNPSYFSEEQLKKIETAANRVRKENGYEDIQYKSAPSKTGYTALHIGIDTRYVAKLRKHQGYYSELQILGSDVELLKDIEDFCYKLKKGMGVKSHDVAYTPFEKFFLDAYTDTENYPDVQNAFAKYTNQAYKAQRNRRPSCDKEDDTKDWAYKYPTIEECGLKGEIPPMLDFNILARIKRDCDDLYYIENHLDEILGRVNSLPKVTDDN